MSMLRALALAAVAAAVAVPAHADGPPARRTTSVDTYSYTPPPEQLFYNWSGFYFGGHLGGAWSEAGNRLTTVATENTVGRSNGFIGGVQGGYQFQIRDLVLGAEVKYSWTGNESSFASGATPGLSVTTGISDILTVSGRMGYAYQNYLAYWKAGWASANIDYTATGAATGSASSRGDGWVAGAGLAYALGPHVIAGLEYEYVHVNANGATLSAGVTQSSTSVDVQSVGVRLDFKFGH